MYVAREVSLSHAAWSPKLDTVVVKDIQLKNARDSYKGYNLVSSAVPLTVISNECAF